MEGGPRREVEEEVEDEVMGTWKWEERKCS